MSAPRIGILEEWMNAYGMFGNTQIVLEPVLSKHVRERVERAAEMTLVSAVLRADRLSNVRAADGLAGVALSLGGHSDLEVAVSVKTVGRLNSTRREDRERLSEQGHELLGLGGIKAGKGEVVEYDDHGHARREMINLVKHHLATKELVSRMDRDGNPVRIESAINAITRAADKLKDELQE
jgi:hypothetical protein